MISTEASKDIAESHNYLKHNWKDEISLPFSEFCSGCTEDVNLEFHKKTIHDLDIFI